MRVILKIRKKGVLILPKSLRRESGVDEGDEVIVEVSEGVITIKPLRPKIVDVDPEIIDRLLKEEYELEALKYGGGFEEGEAGS